MSKFVIECPVCGKYVEAKTGFFAKKRIECSCGNVINVRTDKLSSRRCAHCGNDVVFDQSKGTSAKCPVCGEPINTVAEQDKTVIFTCEQCGIHLQAAKGTSRYVCPVCDCVNDVVERVEKERIRREGLANIIKYEGDNSTFVWKHPIEDFNALSQLIVHESQEAVFFKDGQALDLETPFHCEVYFINKTVQMGLKWGTPDKVRFIDPLTGVPLELGASGEMSLAVEDSRRLLVKLVGTMRGIAWEDGPGFSKSLRDSFRPLITSTVKGNLGAVIKDNAIDILEVDEKLDLISDVLGGKIKAGFEEYGLTVPTFYVTHVVLPEEDPNFKRIRELHTIVLQTRVIQAEATVKTVQAQSEAQYRTAQEQSKAAIGGPGPAHGGAHRGGDHGGQGLHPEGRAAGRGAEELRPGHRRHGPGHHRRRWRRQRHHQRHAGPRRGHGGGQHHRAPNRERVPEHQAPGTTAARPGRGQRLGLRLRHQGHHHPLLPQLRQAQAGARRGLDLPHLRQGRHHLQLLPRLRHQEARCAPGLGLPRLRHEKHHLQLLPQLRKETELNPQDRRYSKEREHGGQTAMRDLRRKAGGKTWRHL